MKTQYRVTEFDFDGKPFCSHIFWDCASACDKHREIYQYGGEAEIKYGYVRNSVSLP